MKRLITLVLCFVLLSSFAPSVSAEKTSESAPGNKIKTLMDLGLLEKYEPNADVTRETFKKSIDALYGTDSYLNYLEDRDMDSPVLYGQVLMVLVDLVGWTPLIEYNGYDKNDPADYYKLAVRAGITNKKTGEFDSPIKTEDYAELIYSTVCDAKLLKAAYFANGTPEYTVDKNAHLLESVLNLSYIDGILTGVGRMTLDSRASGRENNEAAVDGKWYKTAETVEAVSCFGMKVRVFIDKNEQMIKSILPSESENNIVEVKSDDVEKSSVSADRVTYAADNNKKKTITLDKKADYIYNRRLFQAYTAEDLKLDDCVYKFIDNNNDSKYDVVMVDKYENFMVDTVLESEKMIVDKKNNTYKLEEYLNDGGEIRKRDGRLMEMSDIGSNNIVSYEISRDGEYTGFIVSDKKMSGIISRVEENWKKIYISGTEYESLHSYYGSRGEFETVDVGDEAEVYFDFNDYIADIKKISRAVKAAYVFTATEQPFGELSFKMLTEDGNMETAKTAANIKLNGVKCDTEQLKKPGSLYGDTGFVPQLILYKQSEDGEIYSIETARDMHGLGSVDNEGFTLDYDGTRVSTSMRAFSINGKKILGSKYVMDSDAKMFIVNTDNPQKSYVMAASSMATETEIVAKLYNVNKNYEPQYVLRTNGGSSLGAWVDKWSVAYIADQVIEEYDEAKDEVRSKLIYFDGSGKEHSVYIQDDEVKPPSGNAMAPSSSDNPNAATISAARNSRFMPIKIKDIKRGTIFQFNGGQDGLSSYAIQHMPEDNNHEIIFEGTNGVSGYNYGTTRYMFNGSALASYGRVIRKLPNGVVINNYATTDEMTAAAELESGTFPNHEWDRTIPLYSGDIVWFYDKSDNELRRGTAAEIIEGDMIFMFRRTTSILMVAVYRE